MSLTLTDHPLNDLLKQCETQTSVFNAGMVGWLKELRQQGAYRVVQDRWPTKRDEAWRFNDLAPLSQGFTLAPALAVTGNEWQGAVAPEAIARLVFVNGHYAPDLSQTSDLPVGMFVGNLAQLGSDRSERLVRYLGQAAPHDGVFAQLNTAGLQDAAVLWADKNLVCDRPIQFLFLSVPGEEALCSQPRVLVIAETGSQVTLLEKYRVLSAACANEVDTPPYFTNTVTEIHLAPNAQVTHFRVQREGLRSLHFGTTAVSQAQDSRYKLVEVNFGAWRSRHDLRVHQEGPQTETRLYGLTMLDGDQEGDTHSQVLLNHPHGTVDQLHKCIVDSESHSIFNGRVYVPKAAQMTNAAQLNRNLMLSERARVDTKPELQITADNVKCTHGATVSQLEAEEIFYLQSRGLDADAARHLLLDAFAADILHHLTVESLQKRLIQCVSCRTMDL